jgi:hypothetical protein
MRVLTRNFSVEGHEIFESVSISPKFRFSENYKFYPKLRFFQRNFSGVVQWMTGYLTSSKFVFSLESVGRLVNFALNFQGPKLRV